MDEERATQRESTRPEEHDERTYDYGRRHTPDELEPTREEVDAWAERERKRREAWLQGPDEEERYEWARRERGRRWARAAYGSGFAPPSTFAWGLPPIVPPVDPSELDRIEARYIRDTQLALEGTILSLWRLPFRIFASATQAGRVWEEEQRLRTPRQRVPFYDDDV